MVDTQRWLNKNYPKEQRNEITKIDIGNLHNHKNKQHWKKLEGNLNLNDFINLEELNCEWNNLTSLSLKECSKLRIINCHGNKFINLSFLSQLSIENLTVLSISKSNLPPHNLSLFIHLINLEELYVSGISHIISLTGDLKWLENLKKLRLFYITFNPHINNDIEFLPTSLKDLYSLGCPQIESKLIGYEKKDNRNRSFYDYQTWRKDNEELIKQSKFEQQIAQSEQCNVESIQ